MALAFQVEMAASGSTKPATGGQFVDDAVLIIVKGDEAVDAVDNYLAALTVADWTDDTVVTAHLLEMIGLDETVKRDKLGRPVKPRKARCTGCRRRLFVRANGYMSAHIGPAGDVRCSGSDQRPAGRRKA